MRNLFVVATIALAVGCTHTNNLAEFQVRDATYLFVDKTGPEAREVAIQSNTPSNSKDESGIGSIVSGVAVAGVTMGKQAEIAEKVNTENLIDGISEGMQQQIELYLSATIVEDASSRPDFIVENTLTKCELCIGVSSTYLAVTAQTRITERTTGKLVWENSEYRSIPLNETLNMRAGQFNNNMEAQAFVLAKLIAMPTDGINAKLRAAAEGVGSQMANTLREDIVESEEE